MNRPSPYKSVYQRCGADCPPKGGRCREHRWAYHVELPDGPDGERRQATKGGFASAKEAEAARQETLRAQRDGTLPPNRSLTFGQHLSTWLEGKIERGELRDTTQRGYRDMVRMHILPRLGHHKLADLRPAHLSRAYLDMIADRERERQEVIERNAKLAAQAQAENIRRTQRGGRRMMVPKRHAVPPTFGAVSVRRVHAVVSGALSDAKNNGLVSRNVAASASLPKATRTKVRPFTPEQVGRLLDFAEEHDDRLLTLVMVAAHSGLRRGELCGLRWSDVDLDTGRVQVLRQRVNIAYKISERETKTDAGERVVWLDRGTVAVLRAWRARLLRERLAFGQAYRDEDWLFCWEDGRPWHPDWVSKAFAKLVRRAGLPAVKLHGLRHFRAAALISTGAELAQVSKSLGHSSVGITADIYGSLFEKANQEMSEKAAALVPRHRTA